MIEYRFSEEKDFATHYAKELNRPLVLSILSRGFVKNQEEARALSVFFWDMVDKSIEDKKQGIRQNWGEGSQFWTEKLLLTFSGHLESIGFLNVWDEEVDKQ